MQTFRISQPLSSRSGKLLGNASKLSREILAFLALRRCVYQRSHILFSVRLRVVMIGFPISRWHQKRRESSWVVDYQEFTYQFPGGEYEWLKQSVSCNLSRRFYERYKPLNAIGSEHVSTKERKILNSEICKHYFRYARNMSRLAQIHL